MNKFLIVILLFLVTSCDSSFQMSESDRAIDSMVKNFAATLSPKGFHIVGLGGGLDHTIGKHKEIDIILGTPKGISDVKTATRLCTIL
ncbi:MAG TPA: hypothetical protein VIH61_04460 [Waddliaceae bacterium]